MVLAGKRAVITGGGRGIGRAVARTLTGAGAAVVVAARSKGEIEAVATELTHAGHEAFAVACDVTDPDAVANLAGTSEQLLGGVDILVLSAGIASSAPLKAITLDDWNRLFAVNVTGTFLCTQAFLPGMLERGWGRLVTIASTAGKSGAPYISAYAASKHAVVGFTRAVAAEVATRGVTANAVCPGFVETDIVSAAMGHIVTKTGLSEKEARASLEAMSPQNRIFEADEVAFQVLALCDPRSRGVNGQSIVLDGGGIQA